MMLRILDYDMYGMFSAVEDLVPPARERGKSRGSLVREGSVIRTYAAVPPPVTPTARVDPTTPLAEMMFYEMIDSKHDYM